jgi:hypothetical protein
MMKQNKQIELREVDETNESIMNELIHLCEIRGELDDECNAATERRIAFLQSKLNRQML